MGLFGKSNKQRSSSAERRDGTQYWTPRGTIPARVIDEQVRKVPNLHEPQRVNYPHVYDNVEITGPTFSQHELRDKNNRSLIEVPVATRYDFNQRPAPLTKVQNRQGVIHPGDRARVVRNALNDPGPFRAVVPTDTNTGRNYGVSGVLYHPVGSSRDFERATMQPLDRDGRQVLRRHQDNSYGNRADTWPPRDEDSQDLRRYEEQYRQVRKSKNNQRR